MYKNVMEDIVDSMVDRVIDDQKSCHCQKCRDDICALALNKLKPKYVATPQGDIYETKSALENQNQIEIYTALLQAARLVSNKPRH